MPHLSTMDELSKSIYSEDKVFFDNYITLANKLYQSIAENESDEQQKMIAYMLLSKLIIR